MTKELVKVPEYELTKEKLVDALDVLGYGHLSMKDKAQFIETALSMQLNPWKREIHAIPFNGKIQVVTGFQVYLKRAESTGLLNGYTTEFIGEPSEPNSKVIVTIYRKDWQHPFKYEGYMNEYNKQSPIWKKMPRHMLIKCSLSAAFRLAFPNEFSGMPYSEEEMQEETLKTAGKTEIVQPAPKTQVVTVEKPEEVVPEVVNNNNIVAEISKKMPVGDFAKFNMLIERCENYPNFLKLSKWVNERSWSEKESEAINVLMNTREAFLKQDN